ncbi:hypothetical protein SAMN04487969_14328 [Paenibacillus algorifonticola]|uniref:Flagellar protein FliT n=1 Tax=Paenibacillus algorifonticola TaxID=684063 RepID=A0A1I2I7W0_9BACL|nr:hypothetical protein [Paenibacillus algorifonticola]SFF38549.1 hypothetical protein SAMN04487969_1323 [Paenibacillus algorifonticola]SFF46188.1 hypothetical protein SAMN04487969_14328 [Paenibacillus algorifonticola]
MENVIFELYVKTKQLVEHLDHSESDELLALIELREDVINQLESGILVSEEQKQLLREIGEFDEVLLTKMHFFKDEASQGLNKINNNRLQKQVYEQAYASESYFIDRRE